jgi:hypothetical protein
MGACWVIDLIMGVLGLLAMYVGLACLVGLMIGRDDDEDFK